MQAQQQPQQTVGRKIGDDRHFQMWPGDRPESDDRELYRPAHRWPSAIQPPPPSEKRDYQFELFRMAIVDSALASIIASAAQASATPTALSTLMDRLRESIHNFLPRQPLKALIGGAEVHFWTVEQKFDALVDEWRRLRAGSSTAALVNDAYGQIVAMGHDVVSLLLREMAHESGHWSTALTWITGFNPVTPQMRGDQRAIRKAWLEWGAKHGRLGASGAKQTPKVLSSEGRRSNL